MPQHIAAPGGMYGDTHAARLRRANPPALYQLQATR